MAVPSKIASMASRVPKAGTRYAPICITSSPHPQAEPERGMFMPVEYPRVCRQATEGLVAAGLGCFGKSGRCWFRPVALPYVLLLGKKLAGKRVAAGAAGHCFPCARITSIRFKGTFSVGPPQQPNTPSECVGDNTGAL